MTRLASARTMIETIEEEPEYSAEDFIVAEDCHVLITTDGWVKRQKQIADPAKSRLRKDDQVLACVAASTRATVGFFSSQGVCYTARGDRHSSFDRIWRTDSKTVQAQRRRKNRGRHLAGSAGDRRRPRRSQTPRILPRSSRHWRRPVMVLRCDLAWRHSSNPPPAAVADSPVRPKTPASSASMPITGTRTSWQFRKIAEP